MPDRYACRPLPADQLLLPRKPISWSGKRSRPRILVAGCRRPEIGPRGVVDPSVVGVELSRAGECFSIGLSTLEQTRHHDRSL